MPAETLSPNEPRPPSPDPLRSVDPPGDARFGENGEERPVLPNRDDPRAEGLAPTDADPGPHAGDENAMRYDDDAPLEHPVDSARPIPPMDVHRRGVKETPAR